MSISLPPGFRFNPTDEELIFYYLRNRAASAQCPAPIIADVDVYKFDPWDLPCQAAYGDREWYFFSPRDRKYPNGTRPNRAAGSGYWKSTGTDKTIHDGAIGKGVGVKKALVFFQGRAPRGKKTGWAMHEYRIAADPLAAALNACKAPIVKCGGNVSMRLDDWVLCRIYKKTDQASSPMVPVLTLADYGHMLDHDDLSGRRDDAPGLFAPPSSMVTHNQPPQTGSAHAAGWLPRKPFLSELFDEYAAATQISDTETDNLAIHPSLNQLLSGGDDTHVKPSYYAPSRLSSPDASRGAVKRKAASPEECGGAGAGIIVGRPTPAFVQETQRVVLGGASAVVAEVVAERFASRGVGAAGARPSDVASSMHGDMHETIFLFNEE